MRYAVIIVSYLNALYEYFTKFGLIKLYDITAYRSGCCCCVAVLRPW